MSASNALAPFACGLATAIFAVATLVLAPDRVYAQGNAPSLQAPGNTGSGGSSCTCPEQPPSHKLWPRPKFAGTEPEARELPDARTRLDGRDEIAALEAVHLALTEVGDGSAYVWHGRSGRLSGVVTPTASFKAADGRICRHIVVVLSAEGYARTTEGVACRMSNGGWQLEG